MKKTITLFATAALLTSASFAQYDQHPDYNYGNNNDREITVNNNRVRERKDNERGTYYFSAKQKDMQIFSINHDYEEKIESVKNKFFMPRHKKQRLIYSLELQRDAELHAVISKFNDRRNSFNRRYTRDNEHDERNNW